MIEEQRINRAEFNIFTASTDKENQKLTSCETSCFLQMLDEEVTPDVSREEELHQKRIARAQKK